MKPFIHPDIIVTIKESFSESKVDYLEPQTYQDAKNVGEEFAASVLEQLFPTRREFGVIESHFNTERLSSNKLNDIRERIIATHYQRKVFTEELKTHKRLAVDVKRKLDSYTQSIFRFLFKKRIQRYTADLAGLHVKIDQLKEVNDESFINLKFEYESITVKEAYSDLASSFTTLKSCYKIWDVVMSQLNTDTKAAADTSISRNEVKIDFEGVSAIQTAEKVLHFENFNGGDFYFYPNFIIYFKNVDEIALIDYSDIYILFVKQQFLEEQQEIPEDTVIIGDTWYRVNKDGSRDKRFAGNYVIPIVHYGSLHFKTASGVNEMYYFSDVSKAEHFVNQFNKYQASVRRFN